jgi:hypothetical protein
MVFASTWFTENKTSSKPLNVEITLSTLGPITEGTKRDSSFDVVDATEDPLVVPKMQTSPFAYP